MKKIYTIFTLVIIAALMSCGQTTQKDNATHDADTMVIKQDKTDSATNSISRDTTKR
jgi:hypothetical protein